LPVASSTSTPADRGRGGTNCACQGKQDVPNHVPRAAPPAGEDYGPAPDLDHANPELRKALTDWLAWLQRDMWFRGWRLDFVKG
jgi:hypothetical protein